MEAAEAEQVGQADQATSAALAGRPRRSRWVTCLGCAALAAIGCGLLAHRWIAIGWAAARYPTAGPAARTQVVVDGTRAYIAAGRDGVEVVDLRTDRRLGLLPPAAPLDRVDDLAVADGVLFV